MFIICFVKAENETVLQYVDNNQKVVSLHKQMQDCDTVLARMQDMLLGFQSDLSGISEEVFIRAMHHMHETIFVPPAPLY